MSPAVHRAKWQQVAGTTSDRIKQDAISASIIEAQSQSERLKELLKVVCLIDSTGGGGDVGGHAEPLPFSLQAGGS